MIIVKFKRALFACALVAEIAGISATSAQAVVVNAFTNSSSGGSTGVFLTVGQIFNVDVNLGHDDPGLCRRRLSGASPP
jgi:hypothetical protein